MLVRRGLADRTPAVAKAAGALLAAWFTALKAERASPQASSGAAADAAAPPADPAEGTDDLRQHGAPGAPAPDQEPDRGAGLAPVLALLDALGAEAPEAEAALGALIAGGALDTRALAAAGGPREGLRRAPDAPLLGAAEALLWRVLAEWLQVGADCWGARDQAGAPSSLLGVTIQQL